jgi:predicted RNA-binding protein with PUA-like domain
MKFWLVKQEPSKYSWEEFLKDKKTYWDGVRNYQARNNLKEMKKGDQVLFYHSVVGKQVMGVAQVTRESYPDPTTDDPAWVVVDLKPVKSLKIPVTLEQVKSHPKLKDISLIKQSRLSVMPLTQSEFKIIMDLGKTKV